MSSAEAPVDHLLEERLIGYLDPGIDSVLRVINSLEGLETTSSCIGRVVVVESRFPWERREESRIVFKSHGGVRAHQLALVLARGYLGDLWLKVSGPIIHIRVSPSSARCTPRILEVARRTGFKHSGVISLDPRGGHVVEVNSPTQVIAPLRVSGVNTVRGRILGAVVERVNEILLEGRRRLRRFVEELSVEWPRCISNFQ